MRTTKERIDALIDWRRANRAADQSAIRVRVSPEALHKALGFPPAKVYPKSCLYRGYRVEAVL